MKLHQLLKVKGKGKKRLGRGIGSGFGKTSGRGTKGQKARGTMPIGFTGAGLPTYKKLPLRRGLGNRAVSAKPKIVKLDKLNSLKANSVVDLEQLLSLGLINKKDLKQGVKILAQGELSTKLIVKLPVSQKVKMEIEKMGGRVENV